MTVGAGATLAALQDAAQGRRPGRGAGLRRARLVHGRRRRRVRRRGRAGASPRDGSRARGRARGGAGRRLGRVAAGRADQGQRRLRPAGAAGRLGGDARDHHARALEARAAAVRRASRRSCRCRPPGEAAELLKTLRANAPSLESCDFFLDEGLELVLEHQQRESPVKDRSPFYVLAECAAQSDPTEELAGGLQDAGIDDAPDRRRHREPPRPVDAARGAHRRDQRRRGAAQARRRRPAARARPVHRRGARRGRSRPAPSG